MTEREICERIIDDGDCGAFDCYQNRYDGLNKDGPNCPLDCYGDCSNAVEYAKRWLSEHPENNTEEETDIESKHVCAYPAQDIRFLQKLDGSRILQSYSRCMVCGKLHWVDLPMVKESEVKE